MCTRVSAFSTQAEDYFQTQAERRQSAYAAGHYVTKLTYVAVLLVLEMSQTAVYVGL